jgi:hypothetical protein
MRIGLLLVCVSLFVSSCATFCTDSSGYYNVKDYGARGDGIADDHDAIASAINTIPATGGVLYFPPGIYRTNKGFILVHPVTVLGCGMGNYGSDAISQINYTSSSGALFSVESNSARFQNLSLRCDSFMTIGSGIETVGKYIEQKVDFQNLSIHGFWIGIDVQVGGQWVADNIFITNPIKYGIRIKNIVNEDAGDWSISNSNFNACDYDADAGIRIEGSGGGKISNVKINCGYPMNKYFNHGIDLTSSAVTIIFKISGTSIENFRCDGIHVNLVGGNMKNLLFANNGIGVPCNSSGCGISIVSYSMGQLENVLISNCIFYGKAGGSAIYLKNINRAFIGGCVNSSFSYLVEQVDCTNIVVD